MSDDEQTTNPTQTVVSRVAATPGPPTEDALRDACLVIIYGEDIGRRIPLGTAPTHIGRSTKAEVQIDQESVSREHCCIRFTGRSFTIEDRGSTNGTYVNEDPALGPKHLRDGDQIKVGRTILKFITGGNIEAQYHEEIYRLMTIDGLTEVYNKRYFDEMLEREVSRAQRYDRTFSLAVFDVDHFKMINDEHGHLAGDSVLRQLGRLVRSHVRRDDIVARLGGEEFAILLPEVGLQGAADLGHKIRALVEEAAFQFEGTRIAVTLSVGVTTWSHSLQGADALLQQGDDKLYEAKQNGRNRVAS